MDVTGTVAMGSAAEREQRSMQPSKLYRGALANMLLGMFVFTSFTAAARWRCGKIEFE